MSYEKTKSAWNRAHDAKREDERARALADLHDHITKLERDAAHALEESMILRGKLRLVHERLVEVIDENFGLQPSPETIDDALVSLDSLIRQDHRRWREVLLERDALKAKIEEVSR